MASLATMYYRILGGSRTDAAVRSYDTPQDNSYALRALPNEDVYFFVKQISNARVVRQANPRERHAAWRMVASGGVVVALLICVLLPNAYGLLAGYKVEALKSEHQALEREKAKLEVEEAALLNPARLEELARRQLFMDPAPQKVIFLDSQAGSLAMNVKK
jgi:cell division protein FtsL